ncbi:MAG: EAL domain-containing protein [Pseudomonadota bacterium]
MAKEARKLKPAKNWRLLLWVAVTGLVFGLIGFGAIAEDLLRASRNGLHWQKASGDIVFVTIDDRSLQEAGRWPWPRRNFGKITDRLSAAGAKRILFDLTMSGPTNPVDDGEFAKALERSGRVYLAVRSRFRPDGTMELEAPPHAPFAAHAKVGNISAEYNYQNAVWQLPYAVNASGRRIPTFATIMAGGRGDTGSTFMVDYSIDPKSVPTVSATDLLNGRADPATLKGKDVIVGWDSEALGDRYFIPNTGKMPGAYIQILGAETLKSGTPVYLGWVPLFVLVFGICAWTLWRRSPRDQAVLLIGTGVALLFGPAFAEAHLLFLDITPGLFVLLTIGAVVIRRHYWQRGLVHPISSLPNLSALRANRDGGKQAIVTARILNYEEIVATLPSDSERQLIDQIAARLTLGSSRRTLYQGEAGMFAWFEDPSEPFGNHLDALHALFRNPARIGGLSIDLSVAFGVEIGSGRSLSSRLASAFVAADEAAHDGLKWKYHNPETLQDASWKLSMLSQLDEAIDRGEVWVAFQPKLELATRRIIGAEALARWTHPEKGPIAATEFVAAAEAHNRIGKLTDYVLAKAVAAGAQLNKQGGDFDIAVNLSARLLSDRGFTLRLSALLARHGLAAKHLTLELTETAALAGNGDELDMIARLRDLGVRISIDDYGTGQSTLDYLKKIPASEIKIDQSFVKGIVDNRSDRLMVQSTIGLAHSLGRKVVAEGVEQRDVLDLLIEMQCDVAQGFVVGRPMSIDSLNRRLAADRKRSAA